MNKTLPKIKETEAEIREMLKSEPHVKRQNRLQSLYLIVSKQATSRSTVSKMVGFNRNTISAWGAFVWSRRIGEIVGPLPTKRSAHRRLRMPLKRTSARFWKPKKSARTYKEIHQLVVKKHHLEVSYRAVHDVVRYKLEAKLQSPRPSNPKKTPVK